MARNYDRDVMNGVLLGVALSVIAVVASISQVDWNEAIEDVAERYDVGPVEAMERVSQAITDSDIHDLLERSAVDADKLNWILEQAGLMELPKAPNGWEYKEKKGMYSLQKINKG